MRPDSSSGAGSGYTSGRRGAKRRDEPTPNPIFDRAPKGAITAEERARIDRFQHVFPGIRQRLEGGRAQRFYPYLLVRSAVGDHGARPFTPQFAPYFWESPDIWIAEGEPGTTPEIPRAIVPDLGVQYGLRYTAYAHVWNLGLAPILGVKVEFAVYLGRSVMDVAAQQPLGVAHVDLGSRLAPKSCHALVKCPATLTPVPPGGPVEWVVMVRVSSIGDPYNPSSVPGQPDLFSSPTTDRHVTYRTCSTRLG